MILDSYILEASLICVGIELYGFCLDGFPVFTLLLLHFSSKESALFFFFSPTLFFIFLPFSDPGNKNG